MAPLASVNPPFSLPASNGTVLMMQDPHSPWEMDLNTSVTIIFGILGLIFQAGQICYGRRQMTKMPSQNNVVQSTQAVFNPPEAPMSLRGQMPPPYSSRRSSRTLRPQQWVPAGEAPPIKHERQPDRMFDRSRLPPPPDIIRRRNISNYSSRGHWGGASGVSDRARHLSQYNNN